MPVPEKTPFDERRFFTIILFFLKYKYFFIKNKSGIIALLSNRRVKENEIMQNGRVRQTCGRQRTLPYAL
ncbi:hypothetical protein DMO16_04280 [Fictibacillus sp. S7]|nr:hypothetical protein DMO16_04280 [Fictibacillus sp. S7]